MEFGKLGRPRRSVSDSAGDHPRIGFRRTSPWLSKCHPNSRGRDGWTGFPSRTDSQRLTVGIDTEIFDMHCPSTFVRGPQGVLGRSHSYRFDTKWRPQVQVQLRLAVMQLSVAADANKGQTKGLVEALRRLAWQRATLPKSRSVS